MTAVRQEVSGGGRIPAAGCSDVYLVPACASAHDKGSVKDFCVGVVAEVEEFSRGLRQAYSAKVPKKRKTEKMKMCKKKCNTQGDLHNLCIFLKKKTFKFVINLKILKKSETKIHAKISIVFAE